MGVRLHRVDGASFFGQSPAFARAVAGELPLAAPFRGRIDAVPATGPAWSDRAFVDELQQRDELLGVPAPARRALAQLAAGEADCVITGQQPGILGGPILVASKVACALAAARALSAEQARPVYAVYWCGADDSDFAEAAHGWLWSLQGEALRVRLDDALAVEGAPVGAIASPAVAAQERRALTHADPAARSPWDHDATLRRLERAHDLGQRMALWLYEIFPDAPLVVVDARSPRLRELGRPLFERYRERHQALSAQLLAHGQKLVDDGLPAQLGAEALQSGLFELRDGRRHKLGPGELAGADPARLLPSVLLRPLWQDQLLAPRAAVLGPAELAYHAQLAPLYAQLGVRAAVGLPRAQLHVLPAELIADPARDLPALLGTAAERASWLSARALLAPDQAALRQLQEQLRVAAEHFTRDAVSADEASAAELAQRSEQLLARLREQLLPRALAARGEAWRLLESWSALRGVPQERSYSLASLPLRFGLARCAELFAQLGEAWWVALSRREPPHFAGLVAAEDR